MKKNRIQEGTELCEFIQERLYRYWRPEIIALKWNEQHEHDLISCNTIYSAIKAGIFGKISSQSHLRRRWKQKYGQRSRYCTIHPDKTIHDLPEEAKYRECLNAGKEIRYEQLRQKAELSLWLTERAVSWWQKVLIQLQHRKFMTL